MTGPNSATWLGNSLPSLLSGRPWVGTSSKSSLQPIDNGATSVEDRAVEIHDHRFQWNALLSSACSS
jgi:hypothetical protein